MVSSPGLSFRRGSIHRPVFRTRQQPRLRTTVLQQTLVVNDNTNRPSSRRNQRPSGRRRHTGRGGAARNSPRHTSRLRSSQFSPGGRRLGSQTLLTRPAQTSRIPTHRPTSRNALRQRLRQRTHPTARPRHGAGGQRIGRNNLSRTGSHSVPAFHRNHIGLSGTDIGLLGAGASHNSPALLSGIPGLGQALHSGATGHGGIGVANLHNAQQPGGLGLLGIGANQLFPGAGFGTGELGILGAGLGADGGLASVLAALMGAGLGAGGSLGGGTSSASSGAASGGTGSSHATGGAGVGTGTGSAASSSHAGAGTSNSGLATGAGAASGAGAGTSSGVNAGTGANLLTAGLGLGNVLGPEIVQLNNALNSLLGQTSSGNTPGVSQTSASGEINPQIIRQLLGDNRREGLLPGDVGERVKARLRVSHPQLLPDA